MSDLDGLPAALGHFVGDYRGGTFMRFEVAGTRWECSIGVEEVGVMTTARGATPAQALMEALVAYDQWQVERETAAREAASCRVVDAIVVPLNLGDAA